MKFVEYLENKAQDVFEESDTSTAIKMEKAIVHAMNLKQGKKGGFSKEYRSLKKGADKIAIALIAPKPAPSVKGDIDHLGSGTFELSLNWSGINKTPKTDFKIGKFKISLKMGKARLMSGSTEESLSTFNHVINILSIKDSKLKKIINTIKKDFINSGIAKQMTTGQAIKKKGHIAQIASETHKKITKQIEIYFKNNKNFEAAFIYEAMTGEGKFGKSSKASANYILVVNQNGTNVKIKPITITYAKSIASQVKLNVSFKSGSIKKQIKGKKIKTGDYRFWSVVSLATEDKNIDSNDNILYTEDIKGSLKNILIKIKIILSGSLDRILKFFELQSNIKFNNEIDF